MRLFRTNGDLKEREECAIVGGGGTNQRGSFMNFISHYSSYSYSYSYYFQHNFVVLCLLEDQEMTLPAGLARQHEKESERWSRQRARKQSETDGRTERGTSRDLQGGDRTEWKTVATVRDPFWMKKTKGKSRKNLHHREEGNLHYFTNFSLLSLACLLPRDER